MKRRYWIVGIVVVIILTIIFINHYFTGFGLPSPIEPKPYYYCNSNNNSACSDLIENCTDSKIKLEGPYIIRYGEYALSIDVTNNGNSCKIIYNVTDANFTEEAVLRDVCMECVIPISDGKLSPDHNNVGKYCQSYDVLITPKNESE